MKTKLIAWSLAALAGAAFLIAVLFDVRSIPVRNTGLRLIELVALFAIAGAAAFLTREAKLNRTAALLLVVAGAVVTFVGLWVKPHTSDAYAHPLTCLGMVVWALGTWLLWKSKMSFGLMLAFLVAVGVWLAW